MTDVARIDALERTTAALLERVWMLETGKTGVCRDASAIWTDLMKPAKQPTHAPVHDPCSVIGPARQRRPVSLEDLLGPKVLAWVGGAATLVGLLFFFALAVSSGWLGEEMRTVIGAAFSAGLVAFGVYLQERRKRTEAAQASAGAGIGGLFVAVAAATRSYDLVSAMPGALLAVVIGTIAMVLAVRWRSQSIAALGIVGGLLAPVLVGAEIDGSALALTWVAGLSAVGVLVWQRWAWLGVTTFLLTTGQWVAFLSADGRSDATTVVVLAAFGLLTVLAAIGFDLRRPNAGIQRSAVALLTANAVAIGLAGGLALGVGWLAALAMAHVLAATVVLRSRRASHELGVLALALALVLGDVAFGVLANGPTLVVGWAGSAVAFAALRRALGSRGLDAAVLQLGLSAHVALALAQTLMHDARPGGVADLGGAAFALGALATACLVAGRTLDRDNVGRVVLDVVGLAAVAYCTALVTPAPFLVCAWAVEAVALARLGRSTGDRLSRVAGHIHLAAATVVAQAVIAPPSALVDGLRAPTLAAIALAATTGAAAWIARSESDPRIRRFLWLAAAMTATYAAGTLIVTPFPDGSAAAQVVLSGVWAVFGVLALAAGVLRNVADLRRGGLAFLLVVSAKVFLYDLSTLDSGYRVASFVALGMLLLGTAAVWQHLRPTGAAEAGATFDVGVRLRGNDCGRRTVAENVSRALSHTRQF